MCGIVGLADTELNELRPRIAACTSALRHRGPDDEGTWVDERLGIALGHRRLSILDLSPLGRQPMHSRTGRYVVTFNGEMYNHLEVRDALLLRSHTFRGTSDTETMLAAFEEWGIDDALRRFVGMFAFGVWDTRERRLVIGRDRLGEKPLYYGWTNGAFLFASELKAIRRHPAWRAEIDSGAVALFLRHSYVSHPHSIYRGVYKLPPGTTLSLSLEALRTRPAGFSPDPFDTAGGMRPTPYWALSDAVAAGRADPFRGAEAEASAELEQLLLRAVGLQLISDVPLGAFLSGGVDSSLVVALMQRVSSSPVRTFSIGFNESEYDEAHHARKVARHLGTDHTELYVTPHDALEVVPILPEMYCEPLGDSSQIPTHLLAKLAREHVTVSLSGDAGDELFGGYSRYYEAQALWRLLRHTPAFLRKPAVAIVRSLSPDLIGRAAEPFRRFVPRTWGPRSLGHRIYRGAPALAAASFHELYRTLMSHWIEPGEAVLGARVLQTPLTTPALEGLTHLEYMMFTDTLGYLPGDPLVKLDRAAMAVSLETRVPLLDHRIVEFAWTLPAALRTRPGESKSLLRSILYRHVPRELIERPKMGFGVPLDHWLRGPLREWAEELLDERRMREEGFLDPAPVRKRWKLHLSGKFDLQYHLWDVLSFQAWLRSQPATQVA